MKGPYGYITQQVLTFMRIHVGTHFTVGEVAQQMGCTTTQARMALDTLARDGVIDREQRMRGDEYVYRPANRHGNKTPH